MEEPETRGEPKQVSLDEDATPLAYRAVRGSLWSVGSAYWVIGFGFVANILLTRLLTPAVYGDFALAVFFATLFQLRSKARARLCICPAASHRRRDRWFVLCARSIPGSGQPSDWAGRLRRF